MLAAIGLYGVIAYMVVRRTAGLGRLVESQLDGLTAADPFVFAGAAGLLAVVSVLAGLIPARRAIRIDPIRALRHE